MGSGTAEKREIVDTGLARILSALIAIALAILLYLNWGSEFKQVVFGSTAGNTIPSAITVTSGESINPELAACLEKRVGDVEKMKADGVLSDDQYVNFKERAQSLCRQTNPE